VPVKNHCKFPLIGFIFRKFNSSVNYFWDLTTDFIIFWGWRCRSNVRQTKDQKRQQLIK
jgi:hypothetical protein